MSVSLMIAPDCEHAKTANSRRQLSGGTPQLASFPFSCGFAVEVPAAAFIRVTHDLTRAGQLLKIEVLDHIILGQRTTERPRDYCSRRELGYFFGG